MRIVYLNPGGRMGGAETSLIDLLASVRQAEPAWTIALLLGGDGPLREKAEALGVRTEVVRLPDSLARVGDSGTGRLRAFAALACAAPAAGTYVGKLSAALRRLRPDVIHSNGLKTHLLAASARPREAKLVWHIHDYVGRRPMMRHLLRLRRSSCDLAIANSNSTAADARQVLGEVPEVVQLYNAVDFGRFSAEGPATDLDRASGLPRAAPGTVRVGLVATFARWKGHETFLRALSHVPRELPWRAYVVGGPIYDSAGSQYSLAELLAIAKQAGLGDRVGFTGHVHDVPAAMRALDIVVHASTAPEPFGMVIIEAMACGRAVIAASAGGAAEIFTDNETALGHAPGDDLQLALRIQRLASDPELRASLAGKARLAVQAAYSRRRLSAQLVEVYRQMTGEAGRPRPEAAARPVLS